MAVMGVSKFQRFFRSAAGLNVDKNDLKRYNDFVNDKIYDLCLIGRTAAKGNGRDVMSSTDLPVTKGLQECIHAFQKMEEEIEVKTLLEHITAQPMLEVELGEEVLERLPLIAGGVSVALARSFKIVDPEVKNPATEEWERAFELFHLLL